jgi:hypothetical protein
MKYPIVVLVLAMALLITGLAYAQNAPQANTERAKQHYEMKMQIMRAKEVFQQKPQVLRSGVIDKEQVAKARYMMKRMARQNRRPYDQFTYRADRHITGRGLQQSADAVYPKCEMMYRMGQHSAMQAGGNHGKEGVHGKLMMQNCPMHEKMQRHAEPQGE